MGKGEFLHLFSAAYAMLISILLCLASPQPMAAQSTQRLLVAHIAGAPPISEKEADDILQEATRLLRTRDTSADVATPVTLCVEKRPFRDTVPGCIEAGDQRPAGSPIVEITGPRLLASEGDYKLIAQTRGYIKVAFDITWCNGPKPVGPGSILGCGLSRPQYFVVLRQPGNLPLEGAIWAHEYGHSKGLSHRNPPGTNAVMNPVASSSNNIVNRDECMAFLAPHPKGPNARSTILPYNCH